MTETKTRTVDIPLGSGTAPRHVGAIFTEDAFAMVNRHHEEMKRIQQQALRQESMAGGDGRTDGKTAGLKKVSNR